MHLGWVTPTAQRWVGRATEKLRPKWKRWRTSGRLRFPSQLGQGEGEGYQISRNLDPSHSSWWLELDNHGLLGGDGVAAESHPNSEVLQFPNDVHLEMEGLLNNPGFEIPSSQGHPIGVVQRGWQSSLYHQLNLHWGEISTSWKCVFEVCSC